MQVTLPICKWVVEIRESISFLEFQKINHFIKNRVMVRIEDNVKKTEISGEIDDQMEQALVQTYLQSCRGESGEEKSTVGLINGLCAEDGYFLKEIIANKYDELKKKLEPTPKK